MRGDPAFVSYSVFSDQICRATLTLIAEASAVWRVGAIDLVIRMLPFLHFYRRRLDPDNNQKTEEEKTEHRE